MVLGNVPKLQALVGASMLSSVALAPFACSDDSFSGCEASRTCPSSNGGSAGDGGEAGGGSDTGGTSGTAGSGSGGRSGSSGSSNGGEGGEDTSTGGTNATGGTGGMAGSDEGGAGGEGGGPPPPDTTPPTIVSVSPENGATGVRAEQNLVITFSEPMDRATTRAAFQSTDIPADGVAFSWSDDNSVLTVSTGGLDYAEGTSPTAAALVYAVSIAATAEDEAGNQLARALVWSFRTLRRITQRFVTGSEQLIRSSGNQEFVTWPCTTSTSRIGDHRENHGYYKIFLHDITALPEGIVEWESATFTGNQESVVEAPYATLGRILAYHMSIFPTHTATWTGPHLRTLGPFSTDATLGPKSVDVLEAFVDDYEHRSERRQTSQFKLAFEVAHDNDDIGDDVVFECGSIGVTARYLIQ